MEQKQPVIASIGHSRHPIWYFRFKLLQHRIQLLVDCRSFPQSRFAPQYNRRALQLALAEKGIKYLWFGRRIGGRAKNFKYEEAIDELANLARSGVKICLCCKERRAENCHRKILLEPSFKKRGIDVFHIPCDDAPIRKRPRVKQPKLF